ncbi:serine hydrolase [Flavobacterium sp. PL002]|uniref:serine hydrolase domain-containing protein n=1 Tax=Flavobacterium sp. PL002 TaxID=1897058 RepID=UPI0017887C11|nr:serine hydrolase domain-containing protein [Flavobacterium sp. PL002]MBE0392920.1 Beta-lactamase [Flavobacterium sp. PL002]
MKTSTHISCYITVLLLFIHCNLFAQKKNNYAASVDSLIKTTDIRNFNGVIAIAENGIVKYTKAYGFSNLEKKTPLKMQDNFEIMSNSKQITAALLLREVDKGKVDLQAPIKTYLPYLTQSWADTVTVHQLLNHTHGIDAIDKPLLFKPGTSFKYGNFSNVLLGKIIAFSSKKTYNQMADSLFKALKMKHTFAYVKDKNKPIVTGYKNKDGVFTKVETSQINPDSTPADGIITTAEDLVIWNSNLHEGKILKPETYKLMVSETVLAQHNSFGKEKCGYGYGIRVNNNGKTKYIGHTGLGDGFASLNIYFPKNKISVVVLENQMNDKLELAYYFGNQVKEIILKLEDKK